MAIVLGQILDSCFAVVIVYRFPHVGIRDSYLFERGFGIAIAVHSQIALGIIFVNLAPHRKVYIGTLPNLLVHISVVPFSKEGNVFGLSTLIVVRHIDRIGEMPFRIVGHGAICLGRDIVGRVLKPRLFDSPVNHGACRIVFRQRGELHLRIRSCAIYTHAKLGTLVAVDPIAILVSKPNIGRIGFGVVYRFRG